MFWPIFSGLIFPSLFFQQLSWHYKWCNSCLNSDLYLSLCLLRRVGFWGSRALLNSDYLSIFPSWYDKLALSMYVWVIVFWIWNQQEESDSEKESNDATGSRKPVKRRREKIQLSVSKDPVQSQSVTSSDGCLSLLKKRRIDGKVLHIASLLSLF